MLIVISFLDVGDGDDDDDVGGDVEVGGSSGGVKLTKRRRLMTSPRRHSSFAKLVFEFVGFLPLQVITGINCLFRGESTSVTPCRRGISGVAPSSLSSLGVRSVWQ